MAEVAKKDEDEKEGPVKSDVYPAAKPPREDEPTVVTKLLETLKEERERARDSLITAGTGARRLGRSLRRGASQQNLRAITGGKPPTE